MLTKLCEYICLICLAAGFAGAIAGNRAVTACAFFACIVFGIAAVTQYKNLDASRF